MSIIEKLEQKLNQEWKQVQNAKTQEEVRRNRQIALNTYNQLKKQRIMAGLIK